MLRPAPDLAAAGSDSEPSAAPLCDEAHLPVFAFWYQLGGLQRPLTPVEAAETPAPLAMDFVYLLKRMRSLVDAQAGLDDFLQRGRSRLDGEPGGW